MADYTDLSNAAVGIGGLPSGATVTALRDNPIAISEGAPDAPRLSLKAIERVVAGDAIRSSKIGIDGGATTLQFAFMQEGTVRLTGTSTGGASVFTIKRYRNGIATTLFSVNATSGTYDATVIPFDTLELSYAATTGTRSVFIKTDGGDLWCGNPGQTVGTIGNSI